MELEPTPDGMHKAAAAALAKVLAGVTGPTTLLAAVAAEWSAESGELTNLSYSLLVPSWDMWSNTTGLLPTATCRPTAIALVAALEKLNEFLCNLRYCDCTFVLGHDISTQLHRLSQLGVRSTEMSTIDVLHLEQAVGRYHSGLTLSDLGRLYDVEEGQAQSATALAVALKQAKKLGLVEEGSTPPLAVQ
jgi:hypothetical protein